MLKTTHIKKKSIFALQCFKAFSKTLEPEMLFYAQSDFYSAAPRFEYPIRSSSTSLAAFLPSRIAQTTSDWPRRISPAV